MPDISYATNAEKLNAKRLKLTCVIDLRSYDDLPSFLFVPIFSPVQRSKFLYALSSGGFQLYVLTQYY